MDPVCEFLDALFAYTNTDVELESNRNLIDMPLYKHITNSFYEYTVFFESLKNRNCECHLDCESFYNSYKQKSFEHVVFDFESLKLAKQERSKQEVQSFDKEYLNVFIKSVEKVKTDEDLHILSYNTADVLCRNGDTETAKDMVWNELLQCRIRNNQKGFLACKKKLDDIK